MTATIATAQAMLKQQLEPKLIDQIEIDVILEDILNEKERGNPEGVTVDMQNNKFEIASKTSGMTAYAGSEGGALIHSDAGLDKMFVTPKFVSAAFVMRHEAITVALKDQAALQKLTETYGMEIRKAMVRAKARHIRSNGSGIIAILPAGVQTGTTINVSGKAAGTIVSGAKYALGTQWMDKDQVLEFGTEADFAGGTTVERTISNVNSETQITLTASATVGAAVGANNRGGDNSATWYVRLKGTYGNTPMGLLGLIDDGTLSGVTTIQDKVRATTPYMKSYVLTKANKTTIVKDLRTAYSGARKNNRKHAYWMVSQDVYDAYTDSITLTMQSSPSDAQYTTKLGTGHTGLRFAYGDNPIPVFLDEFLPYGTALLVDPKFLFCADLFEDAFIDDGVMTRISGTRNYETVRAAYYNFGTYSSRKLGAQVHFEN